jgi:hypothetical protein
MPSFFEYASVAILAAAFAFYAPQATVNVGIDMDNYSSLATGTLIALAAAIFTLGTLAHLKFALTGNFGATLTLKTCFERHALILMLVYGPALFLMHTFAFRCLTDAFPWIPVYLFMTACLAAPWDGSVVQYAKAVVVLAFSFWLSISHPEHLCVAFGALGAARASLTERSRPTDERPVAVGVCCNPRIFPDDAAVLRRGTRERKATRVHL